MWVCLSFLLMLHLRERSGSYMSQREISLVPKWEEGQIHVRLLRVLIYCNMPKGQKKKVLLGEALEDKHLWIGGKDHSDRLFILSLLQIHFLWDGGCYGDGGRAGLNLEGKGTFCSWSGLLCYPAILHVSIPNHSQVHLYQPRAFYLKATATLPPHISAQCSSLSGASSLTGSFQTWLLSYALEAQGKGGIHSSRDTALA